MPDESLKYAAATLCAMPDGALVDFRYRATPPGWTVSVADPALRYVLREANYIVPPETDVDDEPEKLAAAVRERAARVRGLLAAVAARDWPPSKWWLAGELLGVAEKARIYRDTPEPPPSRVWKLTSPDGHTHNGFFWPPGVPRVASGHGDLCGSGWLHCYRHPLLAVVLNPAHADIPDPVLWEAEAAGRRLDDCGLKGGCTRLTLLRRVDPPSTGLRVAVLFGLLLREGFARVLDCPGGRPRPGEDEFEGALRAWLASPDDRALLQAAALAPSRAWSYSSLAGAVVAFRRLPSEYLPGQSVRNAIEHWWNPFMGKALHRFCLTVASFTVAGTPVDLTALADEAMKAPAEFTA